MISHDEYHIQSNLVYAQICQVYLNESSALNQYITEEVLYGETHAVLIYFTLYELETSNGKLPICRNVNCVFANHETRHQSLLVGFAGRGSH